MSAKIKFCSLENAIDRWNAGHKQKINPHNYQTSVERKTAGLGKTIFASYNEKTGWAFRQVGCGNRVFAWVARVIRACALLRAIFGFRETILPKAQKQELRAMLVHLVVTEKKPVLTPEKIEALTKLVEKKKTSPSELPLESDLPFSSDEEQAINAVMIQLVKLILEHDEVRGQLKSLEESNKAILKKLEDDIAAVRQETSRILVSDENPSDDLHVDSAHKAVLAFKAIDALENQKDYIELKSKLIDLKGKIQKFMQDNVAIIELNAKFTELEKQPANPNSTMNRKQVAALAQVYAKPVQQEEPPEDELPPSAIAYIARSNALKAQRAAQALKASTGASRSLVDAPVGLDLQSSAPTSPEKSGFGSAASSPERRGAVPVVSVGDAEVSGDPTGAPKTPREGDGADESFFAVSPAGPPTPGASNRASEQSPIQTLVVTSPGGSTKTP
jgi:hypothetical protein